MFVIFVSCLLVTSCHGSTLRNRRFPNDFLFGVSTAAYQIEGGWNADGKGESIWDYLIRTNPIVVQDVSNGNIAADSYHNYKRDVEMMRELGLDAYRFSLSWSRILPTGMANEVNPAGVAYYNNLINEVLKYNITPIVGLYHWDLPQKLQELGGFANPLIVTWFEDYARVVFKSFGDRVKTFITFNEPREICLEGYGSTSKAPILNSPAVGTYLCAKNLVMAHAAAYHIYDRDFRPSQNGRCGITISVHDYTPATNSSEDVFATEIARQGEWAIYADPIFSSEGGFPKELADKIAVKSAQQGYPRTRLPAFTEEEKAFVRETSDFFGLNHYTGHLVSASTHKKIVPKPSLWDDMDVGMYKNASWPKSAASWFAIAPNSLYNVLVHLKTRYNNPIIYVTENGWCTTPQTGLLDDDRIRYYRAALDNVLDALGAGVNVKGYMAWSLMDNFEWLQGYTERYGLYQVNYSDPMRTRTPRKSAFVYKHIIKHRAVDYGYEPESLVMTIDGGH